MVWPVSIKRLLMPWLWLGLYCGGVWAEPVRILQEDQARSIDARPYLRDILNLDGNDQKDEFVGAPAPSPYSDRSSPFSPLSRLPVITPEMSPGPVVRDLTPARRQRMAGLSRPFFLVGSDVGSLAWLSAHRQRLTQVSAIGQLVQARTPADIQKVKEAAGDLPILVAPASEIAQALGLRHYPVLLSREGVEQ